MKKDNKIYGFIRELNPITKLILVLSLGIGCMIYPSSFLGYYLLVIILILSFFMGTGRKVSLLILGFGIPVTLMLLFIQGLYSPKNTIIIADLGFASLGLEGTMYALKISSTLLVSRVTKKCWFWAIENVGIRSSVLFVFFRFVFAIAFHSIRRPCNLNDFRVMDQAVQ